jgi:DNA polymerase III subunit epsilon
LNGDQDEDNGGRRVLGPRGNRLEPRPHVISDEELAAHRAYIEAKVKDALWLIKQEA